MPKVQLNQRGGYSQQPVSPVDLMGDDFATRVAFLRNSIPEVVELPQLTGTSTSKQQVEIPNAGLMRLIRLHVSARFSIANHDNEDYSPDGIFKIFEKVQFKDQANQTRIDCESYSLYKLSASKSHAGQDPRWATRTTADSAALVAQPDISAGNGTNYKLSTWFDLPFTWSEFDTRGLVNLSSAGRDAILYLTLAPPAGPDDTYMINLASKGTAGSTTVTWDDITITPVLYAYTPTAQQQSRGVSLAIPYKDLQIVQEILDTNKQILKGTETYQKLPPNRTVHRVLQHNILDGMQGDGTIDVETGDTSAGMDRVLFRYDNRNKPVDERSADYKRDTRDYTSRDYNYIIHDFSKHPWDSLLVPQLDVGGHYTSDAFTDTGVLYTTIQNLYISPVVPATVPA
jgi:hypothetical protein